MWQLEDAASIETVPFIELSRPIFAGKKLVLSQYVEIASAIGSSRLAAICVRPRNHIANLESEVMAEPLLEVNVDRVVV